MSKDNIIYRKGHFHNIDGSILDKPFEGEGNTGAFSMDLNNLSGYWDSLKTFGKDALSKDNTSSIAETFGKYFGEQQGQSSTPAMDAQSSQGGDGLFSQKTVGKLNNFSSLAGKVSTNVGGKIGSVAGNASKFAGGAASFLGSALNAADTFKYASGLKDTSELESSIDATRGFNSNALNLDDLQSDADSRNVYRDMQKSDLRAHSTGQIVGHTLGKMGQTFATAKGGLISKLIQTAAVGVAGGAGAIAGNRKAYDAASLLNFQQDDAELAQRNNLLAAANRINNNQYKSAMIDNAIGAFGGPLGMDNNFAYGGDMLFTGDFSNGVTKVDAGGTHEQNPLDGVPMGTDGQGTPNLVEEGEVIYDNYVYSNRLHPTDSQLEKALLPGKFKNHTYASIAEALSKESEERPNDPISQKTLKANMTRLREIQEETRQNKQEQKAKREFRSLDPYTQQALLNNAQRQFMQQGQQQNPQQFDMSQFAPQEDSPEEVLQAFGGNLFASGGLAGNIFDGPGKYANYLPYDNTKGFKYYGNVDSGKYDPDYLKWLNNRTENDDVYKTVSDYYKKTLGKDLTLEESKRLGQDRKFGGMHQIYQDAYEAYKNANPSQTGMYPVVNPAAVAEAAQQAQQETEMNRAKAAVTAAEKTDTPPVPAASESGAGKDAGTEADIPQYQTWLRYAPVVGSAFSVANDLLGGNRPDYSTPNRLLAEANRFRDARFSPVGHYLTYKPLDRNYYLNQQAANAAATRRAIQNSGSNQGAVNAALLGAGYNSQNALGNALLQMDQYNDQLLQKDTEFNRATDEFNSEGQLKADSLNADISKARFSAIQQALALRDAERLRGIESRSANLTNLFNNLGDIGRENMAFNMANSDKSEKYWLNKRGISGYKGKNEEKNGGYLTIKNRRKK